MMYKINMKQLTPIQIIEQIAEQFAQADLFYGHGTDNAWDEAVTLVLHVLRLPFNSGEEELQHYLNADEIKKIQELTVRRIKEKKPLAYLINEAYFFGLPFYVDERVIIPRSPLAELIENQFNPWIDYERVHTILDLCTGSACIAIACAFAFENAKVDAVEINDDALAVAKINCLK